MNQATSVESAIHIRIHNLRNNNGHILVSVFNSEDGFPSDPAKAVKIIKSKIDGDHSDIILENMPVGNYAISVLHDENDNGKMDTGAFGIPKEGYGASNDAKAVLGPPSFKDARFEHKQNTQLQIKMKYF